MVSRGAYPTCGLDTSGGLACWGWNPTSGQWISVGAGEYHSCAVASSGAVSCWGQNDDGPSNPPSGSFATVSTGG